MADWTKYPKKQIRRLLQCVPKSTQRSNKSNGTPTQTPCPYNSAKAVFFTLNSWLVFFRGVQEGRFATLGP